MFEYKVVIVGSSAVGKSSLCQMFSRNKFPEIYEPTVEDYFRKQVTLEGEQINFEILDTAGQEDSLTNNNWIISNANGFLIVFDITRKNSFEEAKECRDRILHIKNAVFVPIVLVGNKADVEDKREVWSAWAINLAIEWGCTYIETSAKTKMNIERIFAECAKSIKKSNGRGNRNGGQSCCLLM